MTTPYDKITPEGLKFDMLSELAAKVDIDIREGSYTNLLVSAAAYQLWLLYQRIPGLLEAPFPGPGSGNYLDRSAWQVGMTRLSAAAAQVSITFGGTDGTMIPAGTEAYAPQTGMTFCTTEAGTIAGGTVTVSAVAREPGAVGNVAAGAITALVDTLPGITSVNNAQPAQGGLDMEDDADLYTRYHTRLALPITSGNPGHYVHWAREVPGVAYASCVPLWSGPGTVLVIVAGPDRGPLDEHIRAACAAHIDAERPIGATVTVKSVVTRTLDISASVTLMEGYTQETVQQQLSEAVSRMLAAWPLGQAQSIPYSRFLACLLACDGVSDYDTLTVSGGMDAITLAAHESPAVGTVKVTAQ